MRPIDSLSCEEARKLEGLLFDLDDTLLDHGALREDAYAALFRLREAGLTLLAVTGRPAGWGAVLARQWPLDAVVTENGAIAVYRQGRLVRRLDPVSAQERAERKSRVRKLADQLLKRFGELRPSDDVDARQSDFAFDIGEQHEVAPEVVQAAASFAHQQGFRTAVSSVNLHITLDGDDKASGAVRALQTLKGVDPTVARFRYGYLGDSENDSPCFAAFQTTIAPRNFTGRPTVPPRFITTAERGAGFAEAAAVILERRGETGYGSPTMTESTADRLPHLQKHLYPNYRPAPFVLVRGRGAQVWDEQGKRYLDLCAGIAVSTLGHAHPRLVQAITEQAGQLLHVSNYFLNEPNLRLAEKLCELTGMDRAFFCNSGTEAIECMLKLARRHFFTRGQKDRYRIVAFAGGFHGRTLGALAATGQPEYKDGFGPLGGVTHVEYGNVDAAGQAMGDDVAGILVEPIQGEGGVVPAPPGFVEKLRSIADSHGALLLVDEVQTGVGRTGRFLALEHASVVPDALALAKGLAGGVPIGAMLCRSHLDGALPPGSHGCTFGGNPLASAAALAVLEVVESEGLIAGAQAKGEHLSSALHALAERHCSHVECARGTGLLQALILRDPVDATKLLAELRDAGVLLTIAGGRALRFSPPLIVTSAQLDEGVAAVDKVLKALS